MPSRTVFLNHPQSCFCMFFCSLPKDDVYSVSTTFHNMFSAGILLMLVFCIDDNHPHSVSEMGGGSYSGRFCAAHRSKTATWPRVTTRHPKRASFLERWPRRAALFSFQGCSADEMWP